MEQQSRKKSPNFLRKIGFFALFTIVFTVIGYIVTIWLFRVFSINTTGSENWDLLDGFAGVLTLSFLMGGLATSLIDRVNADMVESREKAKLSYEIYRTIFQMLTDPEQEASRRWILANIPLKKEGDNVHDWYQHAQAKIMATENGQAHELPAGQRAVKMTLNCLDYIGFTAKNYWDVEDDSLDWLSPPIAKVWRRIGPYVGEVRRLRKADDYYMFAEYIGNLCIQRRQVRGRPDEEFAANTI